MTPEECEKIVFDAGLSIRGNGVIICNDQQWKDLSTAVKIAINELVNEWDYICL